MTTGKTIALTKQTLVDKVMSLLLNMLLRLVITFLPRSKRLLISWLQSPSQDKVKYLLVMFILLLLFLEVFIYLAALSLSCNTWDLVFLTRDQIQEPCVGSMEYSAAVLSRCTPPVKFYVLYLVAIFLDFS